MGGLGGIDSGAVLSGMMRMNHQKLAELYDMAKHIYLITNK